MGYQGQALQKMIKENFGITLEIVRRPSRTVWVPKDRPEEEIREKFSLPSLFCLDVGFLKEYVLG